MKCDILDTLPLSSIGRSIPPAHQSDCSSPSHLVVPQALIACKCLLNLSAGSYENDPWFREVIAMIASSRHGDPSADRLRVELCPQLRAAKNTVRIVVDSNKSFHASDVVAYPELVAPAQLSLE